MKVIHFDQILSNRVKLGAYQYQAFAILSLIDFIDGFQEILSSILLAILTLEFNLTQFQQSLLTSIYFIGIVIGNFISALASDKLGRRILLIYGQIATFIIIILTAYVLQYSSMLICRFCLGVLFGLTMPISMVVVSEIVPLQYRGKFVVLLQLIYALGVLYMIGCCGIFLIDYTHGDWRTLLLVNSIPPLLCFLGSIYYLHESPRYYVDTANFHRAFLGINVMIQKNNADHQPLTDDEQFGLKNWYAQNNLNRVYQISFYDLFNQQNLRVTLSIWTVYILYNIQSVGIFVLIPFIYNDANEGFLSLFIAYSAEIPAIIFVTLLIDNKQFGRKRLCIFGLLLIFLVELIFYLVGEDIIVESVIIIRFGVRVVWSCLNVIPAESYPTKYRSLGNGAAQGIGKISGSLSPFIMFPLFHMDPLLPFLLGGFICLLSAIVVYQHPIDLTLQALDNLDEQQYRDKSFERELDVLDKNKLLLS